MYNLDPNTAQDTTEPSKPHICIACNTNFSSEKKLDEHYKIDHDGMRPYACPSCDKKFSYEKDKRRHIAAVHEGKFKCDRCEQCFGDNSTLRIHISR